MYEIRHNVNIQSAHCKEIYTTPDIAVLKQNAVELDHEFYNSKAIYYYIPNESLITFCEAKNLTAFPELLFNFIGIVNELKPQCMKNGKRYSEKHIAPSLLISGGANAHAEKIISNLQGRYRINILCDLFNVVGITFKYRIKKMQKI